MSQFRVIATVLVLGCLLSLSACTTGGGSSGVAATVKSFAETLVLAVGDAPSASVAGDFDKDGHQDLVVVNNADATITILLGGGDGSFAAGQTVALQVGATAVMIVAADFLEDANTDLDLAILDQANAVVSILFGDGLGGFGGLTNYAVGTNASFLVSGDFDGDMVIDLAVSNTGDDTLSILLNDGMSIFTASTVNVGDGPGGMITALLDAGTNLDLAVINTIDQTITVLTGDGAGVFTAFGVLPVTGNGPQGLAVADIDEDMSLDLVISNTTDGNISIVFGDGDGTFDPAVNLSMGDAPGAVIVFDVDGDMNLDVVVTNAGGRITLRLGDGTGLFGARESIGVGASPGILSTADFDEDGFADVAVPNQGDDTISILINTK